MEFMKITSLIIVGIYLVLDWLFVLSSNWDKYTRRDWVKCFVEPFCIIGLVLVAIELWG